MKHSKYNELVKKIKAWISLLTFNYQVVTCITFFLIAFANTSAIAQSIAKRVLGTFVFKKNIYNYEFTSAASDNYTLILSSTTKRKDSSKVDTNATTVEKEISNDEDLNYVFSDFEQDEFVSIFKEQMEEKFSLTDTVSLKYKGTQLFFAIKAKLDFLDDEPVTANLILRKDNIWSILKGKAYKNYVGELSKLLVKHRIDKVNIETDDGAIKNIFVKVIDSVNLNTKKQSPRTYLEFRNIYPISISSRNDPQQFANIELYCLNCGGIIGLTRYIKLSDLLLLDIVLQNEKEDYSPANDVFALSPTLPITEMKKEKRSRILEVAAFSDFAGMDQEQPNGLIQIEAKRKININTKFRPFISRKENETIASKYDLEAYEIGPLDKQKIDNISDTTLQRINSNSAHDKEIKRTDLKNYYAVYRKLDTTKNKENKKDQPGKNPITAKKTIDTVIVDFIKLKNSIFGVPYDNWLGSIEPKLLFSKLEDNNKFLLLDSTNTSGNKINSLKVYQHQLISFGTTLSIYKIHYPQSKLNWNVLDIGIFWYRTRVKKLADSANTHSEALNNSYWSATTSLVFRPDNRWGASISVTYLQHKIWNNLYKSDYNKGLFQTGFDGHLKTKENDDSKLFFRFRWIFDGHNLNKNFTQIQLGYSLNIFANKSTAK